MAFGDTRNAAFNKNIQRLLDYFLDQKLMKQRYGMETGLQEERQRGYQELEKTQNINLQDRARKDWLYKISQDPVINRLQSEIFIGKKEGQDTTGLENNFQERTLSVARPLINLYKGALTDSDMTELARTLSDPTFRASLGEYGQTTRQKEQIEKIGEPGIRQRQEEIGLRGKELGVRRGELTAKGKEQEGKLTDQEKARISFVDELEKRLYAEGIQPTEMGEFSNEFATGRILDPLSRENRGKALQWLSEIKWKMINKEGEITSNEKKFLTTVGNAAAIEPTTPEQPETGPPSPFPFTSEGGLVSPVTGLRPGVSSETITIPKDAPKAYNPKTGEIAYWDGRAWIIIK